MLLAIHLYIPARLLLTESNTIFVELLDTPYGNEFANSNLSEALYFQTISGSGFPLDILKNQRNYQFKKLYLPYGYCHIVFSRIFAKISIGCNKIFSSALQQVVVEFFLTLSCWPKSFVEK